MATIKEQIAAYIARQSQGQQGAKTCCKCGVPLRETVTGNRPTDHGCMCSDCYYDALGEIIEQHPIVSARAHRG